MPDRIKLSLEIRGPKTHFLAKAIPSSKDVLIESYPPESSNPDYQIVKIYASYYGNITVGKNVIDVYHSTSPSKNGNPSCIDLNLNILTGHIHLSDGSMVLNETNNTQTLSPLFKGITVRATRSSLPDHILLNFQYEDGD